MAAALLCSFAAGAAARDPLAGLERAIEQMRAEGDNVGVAVAVVRGGEVIYARGFGHRQVGKPAVVDADTLFQVGSTSKAFTAAALGILVDEGKLRWDDPVRKYLPQFELQDPQLTRSLTLRDTLTHRSGIAEDHIYYPFVGIMDSGAAVGQLRYYAATGKFRDSFHYNNLMYEVAGEVIAAVSGMSWGDFVKHRVLQPLRMNRSGISPLEFWDARYVAPTLLGTAPAGHASIEDAREANLAMPHGWNDAGDVTVLPWQNYDNAAAAGAIVSSAADMANWLIPHLNQGRFGKLRLLSDVTVGELHAGQNPHGGIAPFPLEAQPQSYAMGWWRARYRGYTHLAHGGGIIGFPAYVALLPEKNCGVVVLSNGPQAFRDRHTLHRKIAFHVFDRLLGTTPSAHPERYVGTYEDTERHSGPVNIRLQDGQLVLSFSGAGAYGARLEPWSRDMFRLRSSATVDEVLGPQFVQFRAGPDGAVAAMSVFEATFTRLSAGAAPAAAAAEDALWLESPHDPKALDWAQRQTRRSIERLQALPSYRKVKQELEQLLQGPAPQPAITLLGAHRALRFLTTQAHPFGQLQLAARDADGVPVSWRTVLDVATLRKESGIPYELNTYWLEDACLPPRYSRCLLRLSPGGSEEVEIREFNLDDGRFLQDGFQAPKSRAMVAWLNEDLILIEQTATAGAPRTRAGWPAAVQLWRRGQPLQAARVIYQAQPGDANVLLSAAGSGRSRYALITRQMDLSTFELRVVYQDGRIERVPVPNDSNRLQGLPALTATGAKALFVQLTRDAHLEGRHYAAGALISYATEPLASSQRRVHTVYTPATGEFLAGPLAMTRNRVAFIVNRGLTPTVLVATWAHGQWSVNELTQVQAGQSVAGMAGSDTDDDLVVTMNGFVTASRQILYRPQTPARPLVQDAALFDGAAYVTVIRSAISKDGTRVDYYLLKPRTPKWTGSQPLLVTGYAAFGRSFTPSYFGIDVGGPGFKLWLDRGGSLVVPAARGGGERGKAWHQAALRERRQNSYDDFLAVIQQLIQSGYTEPARVGVFGRSNGGLLAAVLGTQRPDLLGAVVSDVPLTDLLRMKYMGMGAAWTDEYGDPADPGMAKVLQSYSPLQNVRTGVKYPPFFISTSTEDNQTGPGHARKLAARLQATATPTFFYESSEGGHSVSDAYRNPQLMALRMTFLIDTLMKNPSTDASPHATPARR